VSTGGASGFLSLATQWAVVRRALAYSFVVGIVLIGINHGDAILAGDMTTRRLIQMGLTMMVPYAVSTLSSVAALKQLPG
jgi:hypothetical protein